LVCFSEHADDDSHSGYPNIDDFSRRTANLAGARYRRAFSAFDIAAATAAQRGSFSSQSNPIFTVSASFLSPL